jgi:hypothetical protein
LPGRCIVEALETFLDLLEFRAEGFRATCEADQEPRLPL